MERKHANSVRNVFGLLELLVKIKVKCGVRIKLACMSLLSELRTTWYNLPFN